MCSLELDIPCEVCGRDCTHVMCEKHLDAFAEQKYNEGKGVGYDEGYNVARKEFEKED